MRLHELSNSLKHYLAKVRLVLRDGNTQARTTITADTSIDTKKLLAAIVGVSNVYSLFDIVNASPHSDQLHRAFRIYGE